MLGIGTGVGALAVGFAGAFPQLDGGTPLDGELTAAPDLEHCGSLP